MMRNIMNINYLSVFVTNCRDTYNIYLYKITLQIFILSHWFQTKQSTITLITELYTKKKHFTTNLQNKIGACGSNLIYHEILLYILFQDKYEPMFDNQMLFQHYLDHHNKIYIY